MLLKFWTPSETHSVVEEFIETLPAKTQKKIIRDLELVEVYGLKFANFKKLKGCNLYEIKIRCNKLGYRFMCVIRGDVCWILHVFVKKSNATPIKEVSTAVNRAVALDQHLGLN